MGYKIYRTKGNQNKTSSMADRWETSLTKQPVSQNSDETAYTSQCSVELFKILEFFWFLPEAMTFFFFPTVLQCESCQFLDGYSCSGSLDKHWNVSSFFLSLKYFFFSSVLFELPKVLLVMVFRETNKTFAKCFASKDKNVTNFL